VDIIIVIVCRKCKRELLKTDKTKEFEEFMNRIEGNRCIYCENLFTKSKLVSIELEG
jgi:hypothetical protein